MLLTCLLAASALAHPVDATPVSHRADEAEELPIALEPRGLERSALVAGEVYCTGVSE